MSSIEIRCHEGPQAVGELTPLLAAEGLLPPPMIAMDPAYLAAGLEGDNPAILVAYRGERPVAFMPFAVRRAKFAYRLGPLKLAKLPYRQLRLMGCVAIDPNEVAVFDALMKYISGALRRRYDVAFAAELPADDPFAVYLSQPPSWLLREMAIERREMDSYRIRIEGAFEGYLQGRFSGKTRKKLRRKAEEFEQSVQGQVSVRSYTGVDDVASFLRDAESVARHTYQVRRGFETVADTPAMRRKLEHFARRGVLCCYILFGGDSPYAFQYGFIDRRRYQCETTGYDERASAFSPGTVLLYRILEDLFAGGLVDELDFGAGPGEYKRMFATTNSSVVYADMYLKRPYSRLLRGLDRGSKRLSAALKTWVGRWQNRSSAQRADGSARARQTNEKPAAAAEPADV
jgi:CelD/BcsL family acetyltransferase involved in cellulose biosynthesis